jgi:hypothetical protein
MGKPVNLCLVVSNIKIPNEQTELFPQKMIICFNGVNVPKKDLYIFNGITQNIKLLFM